MESVISYLIPAMNASPCKCRLDQRTKRHLGAKVMQLYVIFTFERLMVNSHLSREWSKIRCKSAVRKNVAGSEFNENEMNSYAVTSGFISIEAKMVIRSCFDRSGELTAVRSR